MKRLILLDSHAIIHRAYHALPPLTSASGEPVNAVYGFVSILLRIMKELKPDYVAAAFDLPGKTFRHDAFERYKAQRPETPSDLISQFSKVKDVVEAFGIPVFQQEGYEADDVIGTLAEKMKSRQDVETIIVTGDMDTLQLVRPGVKVYAMRKGIADIVMYDDTGVAERYGITPAQIIDFKGLKGDVSDNIPGVKGIGEKTAVDLIQRFGSVDGIYAALARSDAHISAATAEKLKQGAELAKMSRELATIHLNVPLAFEAEHLPEYLLDSAHTGNAVQALQRFGFSSLIKRLGGEEAAPKKKNAKTSSSGSGLRQATLMEAAEREETKLPVYDKKAFEAFAAGRHKNVGLALAAEAVIVFDEHKDSTFVMAEDAFASKAAKAFFDHSSFHAHDGKSLLRALHSRGMTVGPVEFDTMLAAYVAGSFHRDFSLEAVSERALGRRIDPKNAAADFFKLVKVLEGQVEVTGARRVFELIEMPLIPVLAAMEERGILIDRPWLAALSKRIIADLNELTNKIYRHAGEQFNINSSQQLSHILFDVLGIKKDGLRKTAKGGVTSTRESELDKLKDQHPVVEDILSYRERAKLKSTYIDVLPLLADPATDRIHTTFNQAGTTTGRLSSSNPNLQNIPIMSEYGREVRKAFIPAKGYRLVSFDYSQIELRVAAHMSGDEKMIDAFRTGQDIHRITAAEVYRVSPENVTSELRRAAKTLNFGVLYGMGPVAFAQTTGMSREEAKRFITEYFRNFQGIKRYLEEVKEFAKEHGYVETMFGRRRFLPDIESPNQLLRSNAERMAINHPIQGTATGDLIKLAMKNVDAWVKEGRHENDARILVQVHDELLFEIAEKRVAALACEIKKIMEGVAELEVPLVVDVKEGLNWAEQKSLHFS